MKIVKCALCLVAVLACAVPTAGLAGLFGVPTNLNAAGQTTASSVDPPGSFTLTGTAGAAADGDTVSQLRFFIEVTGTTLDIRVFDPGIGGARDYERGGGSRTDFQLFAPDGTSLAFLNNFNNDTVSTQNRLARFTSGGFVALNTGTHFTGLQPGLYEFRVTMDNGDDDVNAFGVDFRVSSSDDTHYNVYTIGKTSNPDSAMVIGAINAGTTPYANITQRMFFYPYVTRGCSLQTSNFDMDAATGPGAGAVGDVTDVLGAATALTMGGASTIHVENTISVHAVTGTNLVCNNYGIYTLTNDTGTQQNLIDWRVADWQGWTDNPANLPRNPTNPIRMYLPNGYFTADPPGVPPNTNATAPVEPTLGVSARVVSGTNPPASGLATRFNITAAVENPTASAITNLQITIPIVADASSVGSDECAVNGTIVTCGTDGSAAGYRRRTFGTLAAGSVASLSIQVNFTPPGNGLRNLTGPPAATASGTLNPEGIANYVPDNTTVWAQYTPAFSSGTYPRTEILGPLCNLVVNVGSIGTLPTRASIVGLRVNPAGTVEFATGTQIGTRAFNLYGAAEQSRRAPRTLLTPTPVPAPAPTSMLPILYRVDTGPLDHAYLFIEEIDSQGRRNLMGPFPTSDPRLLASFERIEARLAAAGARERRGARMLLPAHRPRPARHGKTHRSWRAHRQGDSEGIKIEIGRAGTVEVALDDLAAQGLPDKFAADPGRLHLWSQGREVPFRVVFSGRRPAAIRFSAEPLSTVYSGKNVYLVTWGERRAPSLKVSLTRDGEPRTPGMVRVEEDLLYLPNTPLGADPWFWDMLFWLDPTRASFTFDLQGLDAGDGTEVPVRLRLYAAGGPTHRVEAFINDQPVGAVQISGSGFFDLRGSLPAGTLRPAGNELLLVSLDAAGEAWDYLNYLDLGVRLAPAEEPVAPERIAPYATELPRLAGADYLVVTHPLFEAQARQIAAQKRREGYRPAVVDVERIYDAFSAGIVEASAIHALIKAWAQGGQARHVLLIGDDTFDYRGNLIELIEEYGFTPTTAFIPSLLGWDEEFGRIPSENRYADLDGDGQPDISIGRLPVQTPEQAAILAEKIARQTETLQGSLGRHLIAVDNQGPEDIDFRAVADSASASAFPPGSSIAWAAITADDASTAHEAVLQAFQQGVSTLHYFGHAHPEFWAQEGLLTAGDLDSLAGTYREAVVFTWACEAQWFQYMWGPSINEALLLVPAGGALASFGPAGVTDPALQRLLMLRVYQKFLGERLTLGEAIRQAKSQTLAEYPESRPVIEGWNLLGDPSLRLPQ
jgi:hypothetical protein